MCKMFTVLYVLSSLSSEKVQSITIIKTGSIEKELPKNKLAFLLYSFRVIYI